MSNKEIAIAWANEMVDKPKGIVLSDKFFKPFGGGVSRAITRELTNMGITVWKLPNQIGAILFKTNDARVDIMSEDGVKVGAWVGDDGLIIILPPLAV